MKPAASVAKYSGLMVANVWFLWAVAIATTSALTFCVYCAVALVKQGRLA